MAVVILVLAIIVFVWIVSPLPERWFPSVFHSLDRAFFEIERYDSLRDQGLAHKEAIRTLNELWKAREIRK